GDPRSVAGPPPVEEAPVPDTGHVLRRETRDVVVREELPLADHDRIVLVVVGARPGRDVEKRNRLVQVVNDERVPVVVGPEDVLRQLLRYLVAVAVVVVHLLLAPVRRRARETVVVALAALRVAPEPVQLPVTTIRLRNRVDDRDALVP